MLAIELNAATPQGSDYRVFTMKKSKETNVSSMVARLRARRDIARATAAERLGRAGDSSAVSALKAAANDSSAEVRMRVIEALGRLGQGASDEVTQALTDEDELVRVSAAEALSAGTPKSLGALRAALDDYSPLVRSYAAAALGRVGDRREKAVLKNALRRERDAGARLGYYEGLWSLGEKVAIERVIQLLRTGNYRTKLAAAKALSSTFLSTETRERIIRALRAREKTERHSVTRSTIRRLLAEVAAPSPSTGRNA